MRGLNPDQLRAFLEVVELGSFTAAARRLNLSQPAVSLQIRELEARCGVVLLDRQGRRPSPTSAGKQLMIHARRIISENEDALTAMQRLKSSALGMVRIGMTTPTLTYLARPAIRRLRSDHPNIELALTLTTSTRLAEALRDNLLDLAIVSLPIDEAQLHIEPIYEEGVMCILPDEATPVPVTPAVLSAYPFYVQGKPDVQLTLAMSWFREAGFSPRAWIELDGLEACRAAAMAGLGATILPESMIDGLGIKGVPIDPPVMRKMALISRLDQPATDTIRKVSNGIRAGFTELRLARGKLASSAPTSVDMALSAPKHGRQSVSAP
ncbi:MAG: LysR family transcriptional regulator [Hyphomicrobiaceae bacterium]|nr:LysR family transcriptional regulator [Hyphomicrobiaceae bacterium]